MSKVRKGAAAVLLSLSLAGCATWSTSDVAPAGATAASPQASASSATARNRAARLPSAVLVTEKDITDRPYESLGDVSVTVNKTTIFHPDPTPALVNQRLQEKAAELGADEVIQV